MLVWKFNMLHMKSDEERPVEIPNARLDETFSHSVALARDVVAVFLNKLPNISV
jgi:hypothetical protein